MMRGTVNGRPVAHATLRLRAGMWQMRVIDSHGHIVNEDNGSKKIFDRMMASAIDAVGAVRRVEQMGHQLQEWDWLVETAGDDL